VPVLAGFASGGTLAYAALAQGATGPFLGGISLGFCPHLDTVKELCKGRGPEFSADPGSGRLYKPAKTLEVLWKVL